MRVGTVPTFGFTGELQDTAGLVYLRARWYHAAQGRFGVRDPWPGEAERPSSLHAYQYAYGDPVRWTDPSGLDAWWREDGPSTPQPCSHGLFRDESGRCVPYYQVVDPDGGGPTGSGSGRIRIPYPDPSAPFITTPPPARPRLPGIPATPPRPGPPGFAPPPAPSGPRVFDPPPLGAQPGVFDDCSAFEELFPGYYTSGGELPPIPPGSSGESPRTFTKVEYGSTDLSRLVVEYRKRNNISPGRNVAVFEYIEKGQTKTILKVSGSGHSERQIDKDLANLGVKPSDVTRIYSELEPCSVPGGYCRQLIESKYPHADTTYSFDYNGKTPAERRAQSNTKEKAVRDATKNKP